AFQLTFMGITGAAIAQHVIYGAATRTPRPCVAQRVQGAYPCALFAEPIVTGTPCAVLRFPRWAGVCLRSTRLSTLRFLVKMGNSSSTFAPFPRWWNERSGYLITTTRGDD